MSSPEGASGSPVGQACSLLSTWTGLELRGTAPRRVSEFLSTRATQLDYPSKEAYVAYLQRLEPTAAESQRLINLVTNGLTAFWRDEPQLDALESVLQELAAGRSQDQPIQVWCAGCSSGEEAYTAAMIAAEDDLPVHVLGTDLNTEALGHARRGIYGQWSLRRTTPERRQRFFRALDQQRFTLADGLVDRVEFRHHNILSKPPTPPHARQWDVIMCRNVLIYFSADATKTVLRHFSERLHHNGYLLLGSSEQLHTGDMADALVPFRAARQGGGFVYRLRQTPPGETASFGPRPSQPTPEHQPPTLDLEAGAYSLEEETSDITTSELTSHEAAYDLLSCAIEHLAEQRIDAALGCCEATASYDPFVPENYCLMAYMLASEGAVSQALDTYRKALFLDPHNWIAALESARLHMRLGDRKPAQRALKQALEGLSANARATRGMQMVSAAMDQAIVDRDAARQYCSQYLARLDEQKRLDGKG